MILHRPQRITRPAAPGSLLKRLEPAPKIILPGRDNDPGYLELVRGCPCLYCGMDPCGEAAHLRMASAAFGKASGLGKRPADRWALPLCGPDHRINRDAQHRRNEAEFWATLGINAPLVATRLYVQRGDLTAMRAAAFFAISERGKGGAA
jgi:hypothetical protein